MTGPTTSRYSGTADANMRPLARETEDGDTFLHTLRQTLGAFEPISLARTTRFAALLNRSELKYVLPQSLLAPVLAELFDSYCLLSIAGRPINRYRTLYFDTPGLAMYYRHHAQAANRYKVRAREYVDSHTAFLEVKHRTGVRRTVKKRMPVYSVVPALPAEAADFLAGACPYPASDLIAALWSSYARITLVSKRRAERVTLDLDLAYSRETDRAALPGIVLAEVKYENALYESDFVRVMHDYHVRSTGFSKYCMGVTLLYPEVKHNSFKTKQRLIARVQGGSHEL